MTRLLALLIVFCFGVSEGLAANDEARLRALDAYWAEVSRAVHEGDFEGYQATCHAEGVLVSGVKRTSQPLAKALAHWKPGFADTKSGKIQAKVEFRFSQRLGDNTTAHETGIFHYSTVDSTGKSTHDYIHFEGLLISKNGKWKILMEYQKSKATPEQWHALK